MLLYMPYTPLGTYINENSILRGVKETTSTMPKLFTIVYFLVTLLYMTHVHGTKSATASAEIGQLKLNYQHMNARLQNLVNENQRLNSEITTLQTRASKSFLAGLFVNLNSKVNIGIDKCLANYFNSLLFNLI